MMLYVINSGIEIKLVRRLDKVRLYSSRLVMDFKYVFFVIIIKVKLLMMIINIVNVIVGMFIIGWK